MGSEIKDEIMYAWMRMIVSADDMVLLLKNRAKRECENYLKTLGFDEDGTISSENETKLYEMAKKYIGVSLDSPEYASYVFGFKKATKEEAQRRMTYDISRGAYEYLMKYDKKKESGKLITLFEKAFLDVVPEGREIWEERFPLEQ